jgi:hypothetical protein
VRVCVLYIIRSLHMCVLIHACVCIRAKCPLPSPMPGYIYIYISIITHRRFTLKLNHSYKHYCTVCDYACDSLSHMKVWVVSESVYACARIYY